MIFTPGEYYTIDSDDHEQFIVFICAGFARSSTMFRGHIRFVPCNSSVVNQYFTEEQLSLMEKERIIRYSTPFEKELYL